MRFTTEAAATLRAGKRSGAAVSPRVGDQIGPRAEAAATLRAGEGSFAGVHAPVPGQVLPVSEAAPAVGAEEGALTGAGARGRRGPRTRATVRSVGSAG